MKAILKILKILLKLLKPLFKFDLKNGELDDFFDLFKGSAEDKSEAVSE
jgi:hypothetical protein